MPPTSTESSFHGLAHKRVVQALETKAERCPQREVVDADEPVDAEASIAVVPRHVADEPAEEEAAGVFGAEDAGPVHRRAKGERTVSDSVMHRLEERLGEPVDKHVQEAAWAAARYERRRTASQRPSR